MDGCAPTPALSAPTPPPHRPARPTQHGVRVAVVRADPVTARNPPMASCLIWDEFPRPGCPAGPYVVRPVAPAPNPSSSVEPDAAAASPTRSSLSMANTSPASDPCTRGSSPWRAAFPSRHLLGFLPRRLPGSARIQGREHDPTPCTRRPSPQPLLALSRRSLISFLARFL